MHRGNRLEMWIGFGLVGELEIMEASCMLAEQLAEEHIQDVAAYTDLMASIASKIISQRDQRSTRCGG